MFLYSNFDGSFKKGVETGRDLRLLTTLQIGGGLKVSKSSKGYFKRNYFSSLDNFQPLLVLSQKEQTLYLNTDFWQILA